MFNIALFLALAQIKHPTRADCDNMQDQLLSAIFDKKEVNKGCYPEVKDDVDAVASFTRACLKKAKK